MSSLKHAWIGTTALGFLLAAPGCGGGGYDQGPASSHPYPPPGDFGNGGSGGSSSSPGSKTPEKNADCVEQRNTWPDWEQSFAPGIASPLAVFASVDHEVKTPLYWAKGPADQGRLSWNVAGQSTHLTVQLSIDPDEPGRSPVFVASRPASFPIGAGQLDETVHPNPQGHPRDCPSYWELPVSIQVATQDLALRETRVPGILQVGAGGVSRLIATLPAQGMAGELEWIVRGALPGTSDSTTTGTWTGYQAASPAVQSITLNAWMAKGIMWAQLQGQLGAPDQSFELADGNRDDPRCEDGRRLKVSVDHPLGKLSARQVIKALETYQDYLLTWEGQEPQPLRLAAISPPKEVCIDVDAQHGPSAALDMVVRMTLVDEQKQRALTLAPRVKAALGLSAQADLALDLRYHAFSRTGESLPDFLTRHGLVFRPVDAPDSGIFELSMRISNADHKTMGGSVALQHFSQDQDCPDAATEHQNDSDCGALHGTTLRTGTLVGTQQETAL